MIVTDQSQIESFFRSSGLTVQELYVSKSAATMNTNCGIMRFILFIVVAVVTANFNPVSAFTSYSTVSRLTKTKELQSDQRWNEVYVRSSVIEIEYMYRSRRKSSSQLYESSNKKKGGLDESVRTKLVSESIAPWRTLRLFLYFSLGSGALVGGLITLTGLAAVVSGAKEGSINTEVRTPYMYMFWINLSFSSLAFN
jgi:hypothetical protein